jgi:PleD family two-component response regulator
MKIEKFRPDILLLDLMMPTVSGFEILQQERTHSYHSHLPVIILTSSSDAETKLKALDSGATDFLA